MTSRYKFGRNLRRAFAFGVLFFVFLFFYAPLVVVIGASFDGGEHAILNFPPDRISLAWYLDIPSRYFDTLWTSLLLAGTAAFFSIIIGVLAGLGLVRSQIPGKGLIAALFRAPLQIPVIVTGFAFLQTYYILGSQFGFNPTGTFPGLVIAHVFFTSPYVVGTTVAVLYRFSPSLEEAAISLGANRWSAFRRVTLPIILPGVYGGALYAFIVSFGNVPVSMFLASTEFTTFPVEIFYGLEFDFDPSILAISTIILSGSFILLWLFQRVVGLNVLLQSSGGGTT
jgi:putative spermidine/putrescine transport system permease protein